MRAERSVFKWVQPVVDRIVSLGHQGQAFEGCSLLHSPSLTQPLSISVITVAMYGALPCGRVSSSTVAVLGLLRSHPACCSSHTLARASPPTSGKRVQLVRLCCMQVHTLHGAGHWVHTDNPDGLLQISCAFTWLCQALSRLPAAGKQQRVGFLCVCERKLCPTRSVRMPGILYMGWRGWADFRSIWTSSQQLHACCCVDRTVTVEEWLREESGIHGGHQALKNDLAPV